MSFSPVVLDTDLISGLDGGLRADGDALLQGVEVVVVEALGVGGAPAGQDSHRGEEAAIPPRLIQNKLSYSPRWQWFRF